MTDVYNPEHYQNLGRAVLGKAVHDFAPHRRCPAPPFDVPDRKLASALESVNRRLDGGAFLLDRADPIVMLWRGLAGLKINTVTEALWRCRYADLVVFQAHLERRIAQKAQAAKDERARVMNEWLTQVTPAADPEEKA